ncbi:MAG TPA: DUF1800 domain-containing protein [Pyrinomonadaceae bacterium]|nr:DUF1800 domain-containing protein [Pyrinomonadaceae bacterium]
MHRIVPSILSITFVILATWISGTAQIDPDPNSPAPILMAEPGSSRVKAVREGFYKRSRVVDTAFPPNSTIKIYVSGVGLLPGEGANAFRINILDSLGRHFRFPVTRIESAGTSTLAVSTVLTDELGFWDAPQIGDVLISVTWRGLTSDKLLLGYGQTGGRIPMPVNEKWESTHEVSSDDLVGYRWSGDRKRFLQQAAFGQSPDLDFRIRRIGLRVWLAEQLAAPYPSVPYPDIPLKSIDAQNSTLGCGMFLPNTTLEYRRCIRDHYSMYPVQNWFFKEALYGNSQLRHRVAWSLSQVWVISGVDTQQASWMLAYYKVLAQNAFGNYRDLMKAMTLNAGMGNYLDMARSTRTNPNENYPREILQLFSIGLFMMNQDGTLQLDGNGEPIPTYDQTTVDNFTKVFTGWSFCNQTCPNSQPGVVNYKDPMILNQNNHDITAKTLLSYPDAPNVNIPAGLNGDTELEMALDNIFHHPNVAPFVSKLLIQHLVTSDPTPAYLGRVAAVFNNNGVGVRGDLKAVVRAILLDPEARGDFKTDPGYGKLREPVQFVTNILRAFNVRSFDGTGQSDGFLLPYLNPMAQNPFNSPTVFNYYPPDYVIPGTTLPGPEFGLMTTGTAIARANVVNNIAFAGIPVSENAPQGTRIDLSYMQQLAAADPTGNMMLDELSLALLHGRMSPAMRAAILPAVTAIPATDPLGRARAAVYLIASSSQFQIQR